MSPIATLAATAAGIALIVLAGRDIFDALFHPEGRGSFSRLLSRSVWRVFRVLGRRSARLFSLAGPMALIVVVATWAALLALGWALIVWPHMPEAFRFDDGLRRDGSFLAALNYSLVTLTTLGYGDITPVAGWLRIVSPLEALLGFGLLTASISWLLMIYPVLSRRRSLAYEIGLLRLAEEDTGVAAERLDRDAAEGMYAELTSRLVSVEHDLVNFPISYYFAERDRRFALPAVAPQLLELAERGVADGMPPGVRLRAGMLREALQDFGNTTAKRFHGDACETTADALRAYARDQLRD